MMASFSRSLPGGNLAGVWGDRNWHAVFIEKDHQQM
jgi:hypothetical protein